MLDLHGKQQQDGVRPADSRQTIGHLRHAWWVLASTPLAFIAAVLVGNGLLSVQGYDPDSEASVLGLIF